MAPHRALLISEIISEIFENVKIAIEDTRGRRDLLSTALCSKAFKDPSLDVLWYRMEKISPLLKLIPGMVEIGGKMVCDYYYYCTGGMDCRH